VTAPFFPGTVGCVVIAPDGTRRLAHVMPDPLAGEPG
jgi:oxalate decarboxylase/phosphoglucose isomerase-like protein (cupin superfamily)